MIEGGGITAPDADVGSVRLRGEEETSTVGYLRRADELRGLFGGERGGRKNARLAHARLERQGARRTRSDHRCGVAQQGSLPRPGTGSGARYQPTCCGPPNTTL